VSLEHFLLWVRACEATDALLRQLDDARMLLRIPSSTSDSGRSEGPLPTAGATVSGATVAASTPGGSRHRSGATALLSPTSSHTHQSAGASVYGGRAMTQRQLRLQRSLMERIASDDDLIVLAQTLRFSFHELKMLRYCGCVALRCVALCLDVLWVTCEPCRAVLYYEV
jgi:hypothetical protein